MADAKQSDFLFDPPERILLGPGPSIVPARILAALARPTVGYLDTSYVGLMREVQKQMRNLFQTANPATLAVTGAGTAAMESAILNVVEPGDKAVACVHGYFGDRMRQILERADAEVHVIEAPWGEPTDADAVDKKLEQIGGAKVITVIHGETSTGVCQNVEEIATIARKYDALVIGDTVASLGGAEFLTDDWNIDVVYTGSQKCLSVPPGVSPITFSPRAMDVIENRKTPCRSWYLDAKLNLSYWGDAPKYHHTGPVNLMYALYEGLRMLEEEGLKTRWTRCRRVAEAMWAGLEALGLELLVAPEHRLPTLTTVKIPNGVDDAMVRTALMKSYGIEIAGGLGSLAGRTWRIGLMGASCDIRNVHLLIAALEAILSKTPHDAPSGAASAVADRFSKA